MPPGEGFSTVLSQAHSQHSQGVMTETLYPCSDCQSTTQTPQYRQQDFVSFKGVFRDSKYDQNLGVVDFHF